MGTGTAPNIPQTIEGYNRMWVARMQEQLAFRQAQGKTFNRLYRTLTWAKLVDVAINKVLKNKGSRTPGIDGETRKDYQDWEQRKKLRNQIISELRHHQYSPNPVRRVYIPKPNKPGEKRPLGIPTIKDRVVQEMLKLILEPIYEGKFHPHSYGFRPFRSTHHAVERIKFITRWNYEWVVEGDIKSFFDKVNHDTLLSIINRTIKDPDILELIQILLKAGVLTEQGWEISDMGTPQGGIISPLLGNIYLNELDWYVSKMYEDLPQRRRNKAKYKVFIVRYADDWTVLVKGTKQQAMEIKQIISEFLQANLHLRLSEDKTLITHIVNGIDFLGFNIRRYYRQNKASTLIKPSKKALQKFWQTTKRIRRMLFYMPDELWIATMNSYLRGFGEYYRRVNSKTTFNRLDYYLWWNIFYTTMKRYCTRGRTLRRKHHRKHYIAYKYDANKRNRRFGKDNFGVWIDKEKKRARIVDSLIHYPIEYEPKHSQLNPYIKEEREKLEENKRLKKLMSDIRFQQLHIHPEYGQDWQQIRLDVVKRDRGRCRICGKHTTWKSFIVTMSSNSPDSLVTLCRNCYNKTYKRQLAKN
ncbi:group II intron reverse transcriptase/maturase [Desulfotomaculum arcticum]|uniref:Group II intron reverse transcriptase/maturase n=1 Tax=Desulfotruncus arcticus DSM 17038 TaxID=1121424 RepID=A0A1I2ZMQ8_9FIRM|nr:group II intron reverse transcriptase/maturase [Desulfotruncus arcticus]SFH38799.1 group II intron reverse transcriptase/maturase [Desulfotomaculum arcticum] [Desulfotruncus arcticus DSM 17038]